MSVKTYIVTLKNSKFYTELLRILFCIIITIQTLTYYGCLYRALSVNVHNFLSVRMSNRVQQPTLTQV